MAKTAAKTASPKKAATPKKPAAKRAAPKAAPDHRAEAKSRFSRALDEAKAGVAALGREAQGQAGAYRGKLNEGSKDLLGEAKALQTEAKTRATQLAQEGKNRTSDAISNLGKLVADSAGVIDDNLGAKYGDYARSAARTMDKSAKHLDGKDVGELAEDALDYLRKTPGLAIGLAALGGFVLAKLLRSSED